MRILLIAILFLNNIATTGQTKKLTLEEAILKARTTLAPETLKGLQFIYGTNDYVYLKKVENYEVWVKGNDKTNETSFLTLDQANQYFGNASTGKLNNMPMIIFNKSKEWIATIGGLKIAYNPLSKIQRIIHSKDITTKQSFDEANNENVAFVEKDNLFVKTKDGITQVTTDGTKNLVYGQSVHRDEFGITKGTFWNPKGSVLAFYKMDQSMVADYPIIDWISNPAKNENIKYPMAGGISHQVSIGIYDLTSKQTIYLNTVKDDHYLTNICWSPDSKSIFVAEVNREQNKMQLNAYNIATGALERNIFTENDDKYIEPLVPMLFHPKNNNQFLWQSNRDGFNHIYLYDITGKEIKQITSGKFDVLENKGFDATGENLFYIASDERGLTKKLYVYQFKTNKTKCITNEEGVHNTQLSIDGSTVIDNFSNTTTPRKIQLINHSNWNKPFTKNLLLASNPLQEYEKGSIDLIKCTNRNGDILNVKTYYPPNYDNTKKYPAILYWYGGPHAQMVNNSWNAGASDYWFKYMSEQGFIIIVPDVRGSDQRGKQFEQAIFREAGKAQMEDLDDILKVYTDFVDPTKMGIFGWSYGGFMTTNYMLNRPTIFKAAVAGGPVMDWSLYEVMYTERYMDTPKENPEGYKATNLINQVSKLKGKLLLIHGLQDNVVVQQHSVNFVKAAVDKGIPVDYMIYPGHEHNVTGKDRLHLYQKITDYFLLHLK